MILAVCPNPAIDKFLYLPGIRKGTVNRSREERAFPGGKGVHVALAAREMGEETVLAGFWGGPTGQWIKQECEQRGIKCIGPDVNGWTRTCLTLKSENGIDDTEIIEKGPGISGDHWERLLAAIEKQIGSARAMSVSGSWPPGSPDRVYDDLKKVAEQAGVPLWVDASGRRLEQALKARPFGIHINRSEAEALLEPDKPAEYYTQALLAHCTVSAVTDGADGLYLAKADQKTIHASCPVEDIISTVGCGDCLLAGLVVAATRGERFEEIVRTGTACGAANCVRPELGMLYDKDVRRFKKQVICRTFSN